MKDLNSIIGLFNEEESREHFKLQSEIIASSALNENDKILRLALLRYHSPHSDWDIAAEILRNYHTDLHGRDLLIAADIAVNAHYLYLYEHVGYFLSLLEEEELQADDSFRSIALWLRAKHLNPDSKNRDTVIELLERSIELRPDYVMHYLLLSDYRTFGEKNALIDKAWGNVKRIVSFDEIRSKTLSQKIDPDHVLTDMILTEVAESGINSFQNMKRRINIYEQYAYFKDAFEHCGKFLLNASDEDIEHHIFEEFDSECCSFLNIKTLDSLIEHYLITDEIYDKAFNLSMMFRRLERTELWNVWAVRESPEWLAVIELSEEIKKEINS